jgi:hypothetical protein
MNRRAQRWTTCLHESAHIVTARALCAWNTTAAARVSDDGRGAAEMPHGLSAFDDAVSSAAGSYGEQLTFDAPARRCRPPLPSAGTAEGVRARAVRQNQEQAAVASHKSAMAAGTDEQTVAAYCVSLHPGEPQEWVAAHARVHAEARRVTWEHRDEIKRVAVALFHHGAVTLPGDPAHEEYFAGGAVAVGVNMPDDPAK